MQTMEDGLLFVSPAILWFRKLASRMESPLYSQSSARPSRAVPGMTFSLRGEKSVRKYSSSNPGKHQ